MCTRTCTTCSLCMYVVSCIYFFSHSQPGCTDFELFIELGESEMKNRVSTYYMLHVHMYQVECQNFLSKLSHYLIPRVLQILCIACVCSTCTSCTLCVNHFQELFNLGVRVQQVCMVYMCVHTCTCTVLVWWYR